MTALVWPVATYGCERSPKGKRKRTGKGGDSNNNNKKYVLWNMVSAP